MPSAGPFRYVISSSASSFGPPQSSEITPSSPRRLDVRPRHRWQSVHALKPSVGGRPVRLAWSATACACINAVGSSLNGPPPLVHAPCDTMPSTAMRATATPSVGTRHVAQHVPAFMLVYECVFVRACLPAACPRPVRLPVLRAGGRCAIRGSLPLHACSRSALPRAARCRVPYVYDIVHFHAVRFPTQPVQPVAARSSGPRAISSPPAAC